MHSDPSSSSALSIEALNLRRLIFLRVIAIACELAVIFVVGRFLDIRLPMMALLVLILLQAVANLLARWQVRRPGGLVSQGAFFAHVVVDTLIFAGLLYFIAAYASSSDTRVGDVWTFSDGLYGRAARLGMRHDVAGAGLTSPL